ncbi:hypothetical protein E2562_034085 [Oryza meyeriana var. granulata]|uniref:Strictosidine synthase conserved region domain-containing protein n=1 Tax=Oryza meyeriana var. granulata TaxID=110450 RepID=A0A6G1DU34_9ORYZ|nr:hypothetical protein E2562_034085 [Oryza meyeriana var. granulata]
MVGPDGVLATPLATEAEGVRFNFTNDLELDTTATHFMQLAFSADPSGRLLKYNVHTKETKVLHRNLQFPNGASMSKDGSFFVFAKEIAAG